MLLAEGFLGGSPRRQQQEWSSTRCPEPEDLRMLSSHKPPALLQDGTGGRVRKKIRWFFSQNNNPFTSSDGLCAQRNCSPEYTGPIEIAQWWFLPQLKSQSLEFFHPFFSLSVSPPLSAVGCFRHSWPNQQL